MAFFSISLRLLIPLKGVLKRVPLGRISLAMFFFTTALVQQVKIDPANGARNVYAFLRLSVSSQPW